MSEVDYETAYDEALRAHKLFRRAAEDERRQLIADAIARIGDAIARIGDAIARIGDAIREKYGAELDRLCQAENDARSARDQSRIDLATAQTSGLPKGALVEWRTQSLGRFTCATKCGPTGRKGIVEVVTRESRFPSNRSWGLPNIGDVIVRILKKDGAPGLAFEKWNASPKPWETQWHPEDWTPPANQTDTP